jgi:Zn-dependent protease/CBS domain-containing protein
MLSGRLAALHRHPRYRSRKRLTQEVMMKWSWKIGSYRGIDVFIHITFLLIIAWVGISYWQQTRTTAGVLQGILFTLVLFACVVLHEFGHALTAQRYGIKTRDITLYPIGGVARLERMPDKPIEEFYVALAGPAVNIVIAALLFLVAGVTNGGISLSNLSLTGGPVLQRLMLINLWLAGFNLLPAFPMDGGRILRSVLAMRMEYTRATQIASYIGQGMALLFGFIGLIASPVLVFIALFVWIGAAQEASLAQMKTSLGGVPASRAMVTEYHELSPQDRISRAVELMLSGWQTDFPVVEGDKVIGVLMRGDLVRALSEQGQEAPVEQFMRRDFETADASEMLEPAFARLQECQCRTMPVVSRGHLVGLLTTDNVGEFLMIQSALGKSRA